MSEPLFSAINKETGKDMTFAVAVNCERVVFKDDGFDNQIDVTKKVDIIFITENALQAEVDRLRGKIKDYKYTIDLLLSFRDNQPIPKNVWEQAALKGDK